MLLSLSGSSDGRPRERGLDLAPPPFDAERGVPLGAGSRGGVDEGHEAEASGAARGAAAHDGGVGEGSCFCFLDFFRVFFSGFFRSELFAVFSLSVLHLFNGKKAQKDQDPHRRR